MGIDPGITFNELKEQIITTMGLHEEITKLTASNGTVEWDIEEDDDVAELLADDIITILT